MATRTPLVSAVFQRAERQRDPRLFSQYPMHATEYHRITMAFVVASKKASTTSPDKKFEKQELISFVPCSS